MNSLKSQRTECREKTVRDLMARAKAFTFVLFGTIILLCITSVMAGEARPMKKYFAHPAVEDRCGVIAPWYRGQNGQCDFRVRIAEETLKRYPWTEPKLREAANTKDPELYRYGVRGWDFTACFTVNPQATYHARVKLCQSDVPSEPKKLATTIDIRRKTVAADIAATAGRPGKAVDLVFNNIRPENGAIAIRFWNRFSGEVMIQAIEIRPGQSEPGAKPVQPALPQTAPSPRPPQNGK
jgi:hypothetical protein